MGKHAYLIIAHKNIPQLEILIRMIDDPRNDIYIHIDKKCNLLQNELNALKDCARFSPIYLSSGFSVSWGGYSVVEVEMHLLKMATTNSNYSYYHLLSGQDLPIKSQDYIHRFFKEHDGMEFVKFGNTHDWINNVKKRIDYYWLLQEFAGNSHKLDKRILREFDRKSVKMQDFLGVHRIKGFDFSAGHQWFSITDEFARFIVSDADFVYKHFKYSYCADECLVQTLAVNSPYINNIYDISNHTDCKSNMRLVDWKRGSPYIFRVNDYLELVHSECLFARKFDIVIDNEIINKLCDYIFS